MIFVPIFNDISHVHLTKQDWEFLAFPYVAIDVIQLFLHPHFVIPETTKTVILDTRIRPCHKVSKQKASTGEFFLYSPHNGQKILITPGEIQEVINRFQDLKNNNDKKEILIINSVNSASFSNYQISDAAGSDGAKGFLYAQDETIAIQDPKWADVILPINKHCRCYTCQHYTLSYLHHLSNVGVPLGLRLGILHNLYCKV